MSNDATGFEFAVVVEGRGSESVDTADAAVRLAMRHVYMPSHRVQKAVDTLNQGRVLMYSYGFSSVEITPVAKRTTKKEA